MSDSPSGGLQRHFGLLHAVALNVTQIVGAGVFATIPLMLAKLPGPVAILGWVAGAAIMLFDGMIWSELGAAMPGSGGSYVYLLECYGRTKWGRAMAFLFIWQFLISGPLEIASGLIALAGFSNGLDSHYKDFNERNRVAVGCVWKDDVTVSVSAFKQFDRTYHNAAPANPDKDPFALGLTVDPSRVLALGLGALIIFLLYRRITALGKLTITFWLGVLAVIAWILIEGGLRFDPARMFDTTDVAPVTTGHFAKQLGLVTALAMYSYLGYYNICYIGDEVKNPGRTIPRGIMLSAALVAVLFVGLHLAMLGVVPWRDVPTGGDALDNYSGLAADFMSRVHPGTAATTLVTLLLIWCCFGSVFAGMLGYARIPYGAAKQGHFFAALEKVHPKLRIPHVSLLLIGGLTLFWSFFDLGSVITALIVTRILEQFVAQIVGVVILRRTRPDMPRPYRIWLYPVPCGLALLGWLWLYFTSGVVFIALGLITLSLGVAAFLAWSWSKRQWPFAMTNGDGQNQ